MIASESNRKEVIEVADFFCREARDRINQSFRHTRNNNNRQGYRLARSILDGEYGWLEEGIVEWDPKKQV